MFNADLALSVTMTAISTLLSTIMLPANLLLYSRYSYDEDIIAKLDWMSLFVALVVVIGAITLGLFCSAKIHSHRFNVFANKVSVRSVCCVYVCSVCSLLILPMIATYRNLTFHNSCRLEISLESPSLYSQQPCQIPEEEIQKSGTEIGNSTSVSPSPVSRD